MTEGAQRSWTWGAVKLICSACSPTLEWVQSDPSPEWGVELGVQWRWSEGTAVQLWSECSWNPPPPRMRSWTWGAVKLICSDYSPTFGVSAVRPPPAPPRMRSWTWGCSEVDLQWLQSNFGVSAVGPPQNEELNLGCSEDDLKGQQSNFGVSAVRPPPPRMRSWTWGAVKVIWRDCSPTLEWVQSDPPPPLPQNEELNLGCSEVDLQWLQSYFGVSAVRPPTPTPGTLQNCSFWILYI